MFDIAAAAALTAQTANSQGFLEEGLEQTAWPQR
jgi:hypothetical protein